MLTILTQLKGRWNRKAPFRTALEQTFRLGLNEHGDTISPDALFSLGIDTALSVCRKKDRSWLINQLKNLKLAHQGVPREGLLKNRRSYDLPTLFDQALKVYKRNRFAI